MPGTKGRSGRKPAPTALRVLRGDGDAVDKQRTEPTPGPGAPEPPAEMTGLALAEWERVVPELEAVGMLTKVDRAALCAYCWAWQRLVEAQAEIDAHGIIVMEIERELDDGRVLVTREAKNPAVQIARDCSALIRSFCSEFGLTPSARARMTLPEAPNGQKGADLLSS